MKRAEQYIKIVLMFFFFFNSFQQIGYFEPKNDASSKLWIYFKDFLKFGSIRNMQRLVQNHFITFSEQILFQANVICHYLVIICHLSLYVILRNKDDRAVRIPNGYLPCFAFSY